MRTDPSGWWLLRSVVSTETCRSASIRELVTELTPNTLTAEAVGSDTLCRWNSRQRSEWFESNEKTRRRHELCKTKLLLVTVRHLGNRQGATSKSRNIQPFRNKSTNNGDMTDFRNFPYYRSPRFFDRSTLYTPAAAQISREIAPPTQYCTNEYYFRFRPAILAIDRGPPAGHGTVNRFEIDR